MSKRGKDRTRKARRTLAHWYRPQVWTFALPVLLFLGLIFAPLARGSSLHPADLGYAALASVLTSLGATLVAWLVWRFLWRADGVANLVFCLVVFVTGVWAVALDRGQRADARAMAERSIDRQVVKLKTAALEAID